MSADSAVTLYVLVDAFHVPVMLSDFVTEKAQSAVISADPYITIALVVASDGNVLYAPELSTGTERYWFVSCSVMFRADATEFSISCMACVTFRSPIRTESADIITFPPLISAWNMIFPSLSFTVNAPVSI